MGPLRLFEIFRSMQLHWGIGDYDFVKYKGRLKSATKIALDQNRSREMYYQMAKRFSTESDFILFLIPNFLHNSDLHISDLFGEEPKTIASEWYNHIQRLQSDFRKDCDLITNYIKDQGLTYHQFFLSNPIVDFLIYEKISIETFIILNNMFFFLTKGKTNSIIYTQMYDAKVKNYSAFVSIDKKRYRSIFEDSVLQTKRTSKGE